MKKIVLGIMMCVSALSAKAQVITSKTINNVYEEVAYNTKSDFAYNAERTGNDITTMCVYKKNNNFNGMLTLKPHLKSEYAYADDGTLTCKVIYRWNENQNNWICAARYDYTLTYGDYSVEYSRYNQAENRFEQPEDKIVYSLMSNDNVNNVSCYHRDHQSSEYQLVSEMSVTGLPQLFAAK